MKYKLYPTRGDGVVCLVKVGPIQPAQAHPGAQLSELHIATHYYLPNPAPRSSILSNSGSLLQTQPQTTSLTRHHTKPYHIESTNTARRCSPTSSTTASSPASTTSRPSPWWRVRRAACRGASASSWPAASASASGSRSSRPR